MPGRYSILNESYKSTFTQDAYGVLQEFSPIPDKLADILRKYTRGINRKREFLTNELHEK